MKTTALSLSGLSVIALISVPAVAQQVTKRRAGCKRRSNYLLSSWGFERLRKLEKARHLGEWRRA